MKEFDKWLKDFYDNHQGNYRFEPKAKEGWKAALEWALSTRGMNHYGTAPANCVQTSVIEQELEN